MLRAFTHHTLKLLYYKTASQSKADRPQTEYTNARFLLLWRRHWPDELDIWNSLDILKTYAHTKNELSESRLSKVRALQTDRHTDMQMRLKTYRNATLQLVLEPRYTSRHCGWPTMSVACRHPHHTTRQCRPTLTGRVVRPLRSIAVA